MNNYIDYSYEDANYVALKKAITGETKKAGGAAATPKKGPKKPDKKKPKTDVDPGKAGSLDASPGETSGAAALKGTLRISLRIS